MSYAPPPEHPALAPVRRGKRRARRRRTHVVAKVMAATLLVLAMVSGLGVTFVFRHLQGNIHSVEPQVANTEDPPVKTDKVDEPNEPLNILIMGSDSRDCSGCAIDGETGGGSDTTILLHLSADRQRAYGISIPRDSMVDRPECKNDNGDIVPAASYQQWNAAFAISPGCTLEQFYADTGIKLDHFVIVDFEGFKGMVDAVGGVNVCVPEEIDDPEHGIVIPQGNRKLKGNEALSYVRVRHHVGDGSDLSRIKRQQAFVASMVSSVMSAHTLANPWRLYKFLDSATKSLTTDKGTKLVELARIGAQFRGIGLDNIKFLTIPITADPNDSNRVVWTSDAAQVWRKIRLDKPLTARLSSDSIDVSDVPGSASPSPGATASASSSASPSESPSESPSGSASESPSTSTSESPSTSASQQAHDAELADNGLCT